MRQDLDYDWLVVGSGFGGSVSALRLAEKGYRVGRDRVRPALRRRRPAALDLGPAALLLRAAARHARDLPADDVPRRLRSSPARRRRRLARLREHALPRARRASTPTRSGPGSRTGRPRSRRTSTRPSGCSASSPSTADDPADQLLREFGREIGADQTYAKTRVGVFFGTPGETVADPFFGGAGPGADRLHRLRALHGRLPAQRQEHAAQELPLARRARRRDDHARAHGRRHPRRSARADGSDGYAVTTERTGAWLRRDRRVHTARGVVVAAGPLGTNKLLAALQARRLAAARLGPPRRARAHELRGDPRRHAARSDAQDMTKRVAISSSVYPDPDTHIETVTYGAAGDSMSALFTLLVGDGTQLTRPLKLLGALLRHPVRFAELTWPRGWSRRTVIVLVMQSLDNAIALRARRRRVGGVRLQTEQDPERPNPTFIPVANQFADWLAERTGGIAQSGADRGGGEHPDDRAHPRRRGDRRRRGRRRDRRAPARVRL